MVNSDSAPVLTVTGMPSGLPDSNGKKMDTAISLPKAGWTLIGYPYSAPLALNEETGSPVMFTDGTDMLGWNAVVNAGWVDEGIMRFDAQLGRWVVAGCNYQEESTLMPGMGYLVTSNIDNLAMIIPVPTPQ